MNYRDIDKQIELLLDAQIKAAEFKAKRYHELYQLEMVRIDKYRAALNTLNCNNEVKF